MFAVSIAFVFVKPHIGNFTPPIPKKMSRVIYIFFQTKLPPPFNQYFNYVNLASLTLNFLRFLSEVSLSVHLPALERVQRESYLSLIC